MAKQTFTNGEHVLEINGVWYYPVNDGGQTFLTELQQDNLEYEIEIDRCDVVEEISKHLIITPYNYSGDPVTIKKSDITLIPAADVIDNMSLCYEDVEKQIVIKERKLISSLLKQKSFELKIPVIKDAHFTKALDIVREFIVTSRTKHATYAQSKDETKIIIVEGKYGDHLIGAERNDVRVSLVPITDSMLSV